SESALAHPFDEVVLDARAVGRQEALEIGRCVAPHGAQKRRARAEDVRDPGPDGRLCDGQELRVEKAGLRTEPGLMPRTGRQGFGRQLARSEETFEEVVPEDEESLGQSAIEALRGRL